MTTHGSTHHKRAAKLVRRKPTKVKVLQERFSPTAIFPGEIDTPALTDLFPGIDHPGHDHNLPTPENSLVPTVPTTPIIVLPPPTSTIPIPVTTSSLIPAPSTTSTSIALPTTTSSLATTSSTTSFSSLTSSSVVPTTITSETTASHSISSIVSSPSSTADASSGVSTGAVVGGVGAGIVAVAAIGFAVAFFIRRVRKREMDDAPGFDPRDFRRSAVLLTDPPTHEDTVNRGYNPPPPPSMMQQYNQSPVPASAWGYADSHYANTIAGHGSQGQFQAPHPYSPGYVFNNVPSPTVTPAPTFVTAPATPYGQNPLAPMASPYEQSMASSPALTSQPSSNSTERRILGHSPAVVTPYPALTRQNTMKSAQIPTDDYVDLSRSSVSPFQAAQYAEISRRLNSPPVPDLPSPTVVSPAQIYATQQKDLPTVPTPRSNQIDAPVPIAAGPAVSPFNDPEPSSPLSTHSVEETVKPEYIATPTSPITPTTPVATVQTPSFLPPSTLNVQPMHLPALSTDSISQEEELEFPVPPSPAVSYSSRYRSDSLPPTLPEIKVNERSSISSYIPRSPMIGSGYISGMTDASGISGVGSMGLQPIGHRSEGRFVPAPSPLASSFAAPTPAEEREGGFAAAQGSPLKQNQTSETVAASEAKEAESRRPDTVYDLDDAYGGF